jgi:hypothetical protein
MKTNYCHLSGVSDVWSPGQEFWKELVSSMARTAFKRLQRTGAHSSSIVYNQVGLLWMFPADDY